MFTKLETNRLHFSRHELLVYVSGTYQIFDRFFFRSKVTAGSSVHVISEIHFVDDEGIKFETNRLHLSRQDELVMWAALIRFFIKLFFRELAWKF